MASHSRTLYLASGSPRRSDILREFSVPFTVIPNGLANEPEIKAHLPLSPQLKALAIRKAETSKANYEGLILTADTVVSFEGDILGKPNDIEDAKRTLFRLSNKTHSVFTCVCVLDTISCKRKTRIIESQVTFKPLSNLQIATYCDTFRPLDKAGSYGIQELPEGFVAYVDGCIYNVVGLPIKTVLQLLKDYVIV